MKVAIQGEAGSNSQLAAQALLSDAELLPCTLSADVFERLSHSREVDAAVLPIENSLHGAVADHSDLLLKHDVVVVGELSLRIRHALIAAGGVRLEDVQQVFSHPVALSQCRQFFAARPGMKAMPFYDTAGAVKHVVEGNLRTTAAIAAPYAAAMYAGNILQGDLEDDPLNFTRFFLLARTADAERIRPPAAEINKMSLAFDLPHRPGSLREALALLHGEGADLTRIESRPVPGRPWEYLFFVDLRIPSNAAADSVLRHLEGICHMVKEFGRYAAAAPLETAVSQPEAESFISSPS